LTDTIHDDMPAQISSRLILTLGLIAAWGVAPAQFSVDSLNALYDRAWQYNSTPRPLDPHSAADDLRLPDMSKKAIAHRMRFWEDVITRLDQVDPSALHGSDRINYEVFRYFVEDQIAEYRFQGYLMPFNAEGGFHTDLGFLVRSSAFEDREDFETYLIKLFGFTEYFDQQIELLREAIQRGYTLPAVIMKDFDKTAEAFVVDDPEESVYFKPFLSIPATVQNSELMRERGLQVVAQVVIPAYQKLVTFLRNEYIPSCRNTIGASKLPNGPAYYSQRLGHFTTLGMNAQEVFDLGQTEVKRIHAEMLAIIDSLEFKGTFADFLQFLRTDPRFYAKTPHELLAEASFFSKKIDGKLPEYFGKLPRLSYGVAQVPDEIAPRYTGGRYSQGSYKNHKAGSYWINTYRLESRPLYVLPSLTLHEAVPGHHFQISLAAESNDVNPLPEFRNDYYISAYGEGWALYCEYLGREMGIYDDLYQKFGALTYEMWRACRLVVDPGMHAFGWSRDRAIQFMAENTALSLHEINTEINRYIGWPGQAVSYKTGELRIRQLRTEAEERLGDKFDLRTFHDKILENGSVPLFVLERVVKEWVNGYE